jgi:hypothetical protein
MQTCYISDHNTAMHRYKPDMHNMIELTKQCMDCRQAKGGRLCRLPSLAVIWHSLGGHAEVNKRSISICRRTGTRCPSIRWRSLCP